MFLLYNERRTKRDEKNNSVMQRAENVHTTGLRRKEEWVFNICLNMPVWLLPVHNSEAKQTNPYEDPIVRTLRFGMMREVTM